ncbi:MAG: UDP-N-acetylmuramyl-tripeptide synthetase, partial [Candidatus Paceibacterota bacterium]
MMHLRRTLLAPYHYTLAMLSTPLYRFPSRSLTVIGVTGTKGKSSVAEMLYAILTATGYTTALAGTIRFVIGTESRPNLFKMTLPGRGFVQKFLAEARAKKCTHAVVEITSEAALQYRHRGLELDALVFTNLQKEHVESHGSMENYFRAKFTIARALLRSIKRPRSIIAHADDPYGARFLALPVEQSIPFSLADAKQVQASERGVSFSYKETDFSLALPGTFNILNALAAIKAAESLGVPLPTCAKALREISHISGRVERIEAGQNFIAVVDYAHTPDSLKALYSAFPSHKKICVLGNTGGGRDTWKRPEMGRIADETCEKVILTNEDPYDEDPRAIVEAMALGMARTPEIIMDRREAIRAALAAAKEGDEVLISGKG